tara:strand:- start:1048 stop:1260 length:213 start_codon:yes stop_codon:yes gene_type:complete
MTSSTLGDMHPDEYTTLSEWDHFVHDEAQSRGINLKDEQAMEDLDEELQQQAQDHRDHLEMEAYEQSIGH